MEIRFRKVEACPVCASADLHFVMRGKNSDSLLTQFSILKCSRCSVAITDPQPLQEDLGKLYDSRTSPDFVPSTGGIGKLRELLFKQYIDAVLRNVRGSDLNILDYGCGDGLLSLLLSGHPRCGRLTASDFHSAAPPLLSQAERPASYLSYDDFASSTEDYDLIVCRQVLEHLPDPIAGLRLLRRHMKNRATLFIEVPNFETVWRSLFGANWSMLYLPRHLTHYSPSSLRAMLERAGFRVRKLKQGHFPGMQSSLFSLFGLPSASPGLISVALFPLQITLDLLFGRSTVIAAYAELQHDRDRQA